METRKPAILAFMLIAMFFLSCTTISNDGPKEEFNSMPRSGLFSATTSFFESIAKKDSAHFYSMINDSIFWRNMEQQFPNRDNRIRNSHAIIFIMFNVIKPSIRAKEQSFNLLDEICIRDVRKTNATCFQVTVDWVPGKLKIPNSHQVLVCKDDHGWKIRNLSVSEADLKKMFDGE